MITVSQLTIYPFKSAQGINLPHTGFDAEGMINDRRLMAIDEKGIFITARRNPQLLHLTCQISDQGWTLSHPEQTTDCTISTHLTSHTALSGQVWRDTINALDAGEEAASWLSTILGQTVRLALWQPHARHSAKYQLDTSFADAAPLLLVSEASMQQASDWADIAYDPRRFRPNIVLSGVEAFAEDQWQRIQIGNTVFELLDPCVRCILTTRDPDSGIAHPDKQPMHVLSQKHANHAGQPLMGMNARLVSKPDTAQIKLGDQIICL